MVTTKVAQRNGSLPTQYDASDIAIVRIRSAQALASYDKPTEEIQ